MKKHQAEVEKVLLGHEKEVYEKLKATYEQALKDINKKSKELQDAIDKLVEKEPDNESLIRSKIYQLNYQKTLKAQISGYLDVLKRENVKDINGYMKIMYEDSYISNFYSLNKEGVPVTAPINQELLIKALTYDANDVPLSKRVYANVEKAKKDVLAEIQRGISTGMSDTDIARNIQNRLGVSYRKAKQIAQNEGHRVKTDARIDSMHEAKKKGADIVKVWDATLDGKTRPIHAELDQKHAEIDEPFKYSGGEVQAPKKFGIAALDINCRCALLSVPRWDIEDTVTKRDNITGELIEAKNYAEWKEKYADVHKEYINAHPNKKIYLESDSEQHSRYLKVLGAAFVPKAVHEFTQLKADKEKWNDLKAKYRTVNRYKVDYGEVTASEILELDKQVYLTKRKFTQNKFVVAGNIGVLKEEDGYIFALSKINNETDKAYIKFTGDKTSLLLLDKDRHYETLKEGDLVDGIVNTHDRAYDSEAKMFEYLRKKHKPNDKFTITILSERNMCESCRGVYEQFKKDFPNAIINVVSGRKSKKGNSPWKYRKISKE